MKVLGFRAEPKAPRYAIVAEANGASALLNAATDNKLKFPAMLGEDDDAERVAWIYHEVARILDAHPDIAKVVIKSNEYTRTDTKSKRKSSHIDAAVMLCCALRNVPVSIKVYSSLGTTSGNTLRHAEARVGRTEKYWDTKMADAVNAAWKGIQQP